MLKLYNTFAKKKQEFKTIHPGKVSTYTCGPTVYNYIHIGNLRAYITADILRRYLNYLGFEVRQIKNITDVGHLSQDDVDQGDSGEDKITRKALAEKKTPQEIAEYYENYFHKTEKKMNILPANYFPQATAHVDQMIKIISELIKKGYAYEKNGNVFYDVTKFKNYGKLSGNTLAKLKTGARLEKHPDKKNPWDFALWLVAPKKHLMKFPSPWSLGYPGWHIECTAMSLEYLGNTLDIHTGGEDNIFPHHEAEIAQSEAYTGKVFAHYWIHTRHLLVDGEKMSKSNGNFYTLEDIEKKGFHPMDLRLLFLSSHYRSQLNFTWTFLTQSRNNRKKIVNWLENLTSFVSPKTISNPSLNIQFYQKKFEKAMNDDLNTPLALSVLYELITETNKLQAKNNLNQSEIKSILLFWKKINTVFGLVIKEKEAIPEKIKVLAEKRKKAKIQKDFQMADKLRKMLEEKNYILKDLKNNEYSLKKRL